MRQFHNKDRTGQLAKIGERGFSRIDCLAIISVICMVGFWLGFSRLGERGRIARCALNLKRLGENMQIYVKDHEGGLTPAGIDEGKAKISWDMDLDLYIEPEMTKAAKSIYDKKQLFEKVQSWYVCPSDPRKRGNRRSYAMSAHDMHDWPPRATDKTGVGVFWNPNNIKNLLDQDTATKAIKDPSLLPALELSVLPDPANTLLLTELISHSNMMGNLSEAEVWNVRQQGKILAANLARFHGGKFNYLMADGHVELLSASQTGQVGNKPAGIWTIDGGD